MVGGEMLAGDVDLPRMLELARENAGMAEYLGQHLENAGSETPVPADASLLHLLAAAVQDGTLSRSEATGISLVMFGAGGESTSALLGSTVRLLAADAVMATQLRENPELIPRFVEEVVRLEPPFKFHYRAVRRTCELAGFELQPDDRLMLLWAAANRDPAIFEAPHEMRLNRKHPKHHLSFGRGGHFCVGAQLARLEARIVVEELLDRTSRLGLDPDHPPVHARSIFTRRLDHLPLIIE
jgi:cytochrome P450